MDGRAAHRPESVTGAAGRADAEQALKRASHLGAEKREKWAGAMQADDDDGTDDDGDSSPMDLAAAAVVPSAPAAAGRVS